MLIQHRKKPPSHLDHPKTVQHFKTLMTLNFEWYISNKNIKCSPFVPFVKRVNVPSLSFITHNENEKDA